MKPAASGIADSDRTSQYGRAAFTDSIHGAPDCHSAPRSTPAIVRSDTIMTTPATSSQYATVDARARCSVPRESAATRAPARRPPRSREAEHGQVRVADHPVGEVHRLVHGHLRLRRPLHADDEVEERRHGDEPQARIAREDRRRRAATATGS